MNRDDLAVLMRGATDSLVTHPPAMQEIHAEAHELRRRVRRTRVVWTAAAAAAVSAVVLSGVGGALLDFDDGSTGPSQPGDVTPAPASECIPTISEIIGPKAEGSSLAQISESCKAVPLVEDGYQPAMSPDGSLIAFARRLDQGTALMVRDQTSGIEVKVAQTSDTLGDPDFSPDGRALAFWLNDGGGHPYIYTVSLGSGDLSSRLADRALQPYRLTKGTLNEVWPRWSPEGGRIAFARGPELIVFDLATQTESVLSEAPAGLSYPFWGTTDSDPSALYGIDAGAPGDASEFRILRVSATTGAVESISEPHTGRFVDAATTAAGAMRVAATDGSAKSTITTFDAAGSPVSTEVVPGLPVVRGTALGQLTAQDVNVEGEWKVKALVGAHGASVLTGPYRDRLRLTFDHGTLGGSSGCNDIFGSYLQSGDGGQDLLFPHKDLGSTLVGCQEPPLVTRLLAVRHISESDGIVYLHADNWMIIVELQRP